MATSSTPIKAGDTVWSTDGEEALFVARVDDGFIVRPLYDGGDPDVAPYPDGVALWPSVHQEPPVARYDEESRKALERLAAVRKEVAELEAQRHRLNVGHREVMQRLEQHEALRMLDALLNGTVTHYVVEESDPAAFKVYTASNMNGRVHSDTVLELRKTYAGGGLRWCIGRSGYGSAQTVWPFESEDAAKAHVERLLNEAVPAAVADINRGQQWAAMGLLRKFTASGVPQAPELVAAWQAHERKQAQEALDAAAKKLAEARAAAEKHGINTGVTA